MDTRAVGTETTLAQRYRGRTEVTALYAQDAWRLREDLVLTLGLRHERFVTRDGDSHSSVACDIRCLLSPSSSSPSNRTRR